MGAIRHPQKHLRTGDGLESIDGMRPLYRECSRKGILPAYPEPHFGFIKKPHETKKQKPWRFTIILRICSAREVNPIKLFQKGLSNKEAAQTLYLSVNTVRWYAGRIFARLDVKRRGQAVSKAVKLNLIRLIFYITRGPVR